MLRALDKVPAGAGEIAVVVARARHSIAAVQAGKRYRPLLRHAICRLIELLEEHVNV